jgi:hypothetical protein
VVAGLQYRPASKKHYGHQFFRIRKCQIYFYNNNTWGTDYLAYYHRALVQGFAIIAVVTHDHATRGKVRSLLKTYGAHAMTYFGQFVT